MKDSDFSSPESDLNDASDRFIDASLRGVAEDLRQNDAFLDSIEGRLDQVDREAPSAVSSESAGEGTPATGRSWWGQVAAAAAAVVVIAFGIQKFAPTEESDRNLALVEPSETDEDHRLSKTTSDGGDGVKNLSQSHVDASGGGLSRQVMVAGVDEPISPAPATAEPAAPESGAPGMSVTAVTAPDSSPILLAEEQELSKPSSAPLPQEGAGLAGSDTSSVNLAAAPPMTKSQVGDSVERRKFRGMDVQTGGVEVDAAAPVSLSVTGAHLASSDGDRSELARSDAAVYFGISGGASLGSGGMSMDPEARITSSDYGRKAVWVDRFADPRGEGPPMSVGSGERYGALVDNRFVSPLDEPLSTFSVDVDTASYTNLRRLIQSGANVPPDAVRIEEMINYFSYDYPQPDGEHPFAMALETAACPWNSDHQLLRVGIQGEDMERDERPDANLVFLLDVSGSMNSADKLPLVKQSMSLLVEELTENDCVSIVVYAGAEGLALPATPGSEQARILRSLDRLKSGGSTNGGAGIQLAYQMAAENYIEDGINRVILCTDGDFNVGKTGDGDLVKLVQRKAKTGVFLSVLGFGTGNINDSMMEKITNEGNGTYYYVDSFLEARKVFLQDLMGTLVTIAKDVKIQVEFNPAQVQSYRLIGYANRMLEAEDFENDKVDAGEVGAGHAVTALYEIVPAGVKLKAGDVANPNTGPALRYQKEERPPMKIVDNGELATVKLRYKRPDADTSIPMQASVVANDRKWKKASDDFQFSAAVALFGLQLRGGEFAGSGTLKDVIEMAEDGMGADAFGRREEFVQLIQALRPRLKD